MTRLITSGKKMRKLSKPVGSMSRPTAWFTISISANTPRMTLSTPSCTARSKPFRTLWQSAHRLYLAGRRVFQKRRGAGARGGYRVGFTTNPRGPVMYNWIPQAEKVDPNHPDWLPEIPAGDPLMTLPRYWSMDAAYRIDDVITIGDEAVTAAEKSKATELEYYDIVCKSRTGEIPAAAP